MRNGYSECFVHSDGDPQQYAKALKAFRREAEEWNKSHPVGGEGLQAVRPVTLECGVTVNEPDSMDAVEFLSVPEPPDRVISDEDGIRVYCPWGSLARELSWSELDTPEKLLAWIRCYSIMTWCDNEVICGMINAFDERHNCVPPYME